MRNLLKRALCITLIFIMLFSIADLTIKNKSKAADSYTLLDSDVVVSGGVITSTSYSGLADRIIIPYSLGGQIVTGIADSVFYDNNVPSRTLWFSERPGYDVVWTCVYSDPSGGRAGILTYGAGEAAICRGTYTAVYTPKTYTLQNDDVVVNNGIIESVSNTNNAMYVEIPVTLDNQLVTGIADSIFFDANIPLRRLRFTERPGYNVVWTCVYSDPSSGRNMTYTYSAGEDALCIGTYTATYTDASYTLQDSDVTVTGGVIVATSYSGDSKYLKVPVMLDGQLVEGIGDSIFYDETIPDRILRFTERPGNEVEWECAYNDPSSGREVTVTYTTDQDAPCIGTYTATYREAYYTLKDTDVEVQNGIITFVSNTDNATYLIVPAVLDGQVVTGITESLFYDENIPDRRLRFAQRPGYDVVWTCTYFDSASGRNASISYGPNEDAICIGTYSAVYSVIEYTLQDDDVVVNNGIIESASNTNNALYLTIPRMLDGQLVTGIADTLFYDSNNPLRRLRFTARPGYDVVWSCVYTDTSNGRDQEVLYGPGEDAICRGTYTATYTPIEYTLTDDDVVVDNGTIISTSNTGNAMYLYIPAVLDGQVVTEIVDTLFCDNLIPERKLRFVARPGYDVVWSRSYTDPSSGREAVETYGSDVDAPCSGTYTSEYTPISYTLQDDDVVVLNGIIVSVSNTGNAVYLTMPVELDGQLVTGIADSLLYDADIPERVLRFSHRTGYSVIWSRTYTDPSSGREVVVTYVPDEDAECVGTFSAEYTPNKHNISFMDGDSEFTSMIVDYDMYIENSPTPTKTSHSFDGWFMADGTEWIFGSEGTIVHSDTILYARWTEIKYTVSFDSNSGTSVASVNQITYNNPTGNIDNPQRAGCDFVGWYTDESLLTKWDLENDGVTEDMTLYAKWTADVSFMVDGNLYKKVTVDADTTVSAPEQNPTKKGYSFDAWYKDSNCTIPWDFANDNVTYSISIYCGWNINKYEVTYLDYDGTVLGTETLNYLADLTYPDDPSREGYLFDGWDSDITQMPANSSGTVITATYIEEIIEPTIEPVIEPTVEPTIIVTTEPTQSSDTIDDDDTAGDGAEQGGNRWLVPTLLGLGIIIIAFLILFIIRRRKNTM